MESTREPPRPPPRPANAAVLGACAPELSQILRETLEPEGFSILQNDLSADLVARARARQPALIILDETSSEAVLGDGAKTLETLKSGAYTSPIPVAVLLPPGSGEDLQLEGFRRGADDCIARPGSPELLRARLLAIARRYCPPTETADVLAADGMSVDLRARKVSVPGRSVALTRKEFDLLTMLMRRRGIVVYTTHLYHSVWGYGDSSPVDAHTVKVHVSSLRGKLGETLGRKIVNLPGLGYRFDG